MLSGRNKRAEIAAIPVQGALVLDTSRTVRDRSGAKKTKLDVKMEGGLEEETSLAYVQGDLIRVLRTVVVWSGLCVWIGFGYGVRFGGWVCSTGGSSSGGVRGCFGSGWEEEDAGRYYSGGPHHFVA